MASSNNTNKLSPQELVTLAFPAGFRSNNTNKLSPQEHNTVRCWEVGVQIIQINLVLKNPHDIQYRKGIVQIIQINLVLKNKIIYISI